MAQGGAVGRMGAHREQWGVGDCMDAYLVGATLVDAGLHENAGGEGGEGQSNRERTSTCMQLHSVQPCPLMVPTPADPACPERDIA